MLDFSYKASPRDYPRRSDKLKQRVSLNGSDEKLIFVSAAIPKDGLAREGKRAM